MDHYYSPPWVATSPWRIFIKGFRMLFFPTKKAKKELGINDFKKELSTLISEARKAGVNWHSLADALEDESRRLHEYWALTSPLF